MLWKNTQHSVLERSLWKVPKRKKQLSSVCVIDNRSFNFYSISLIIKLIFYLKRLASRSHSNKHKISPSLTGPLTFLTMERPVPVPASASINSTRTWVTLPVFPVRPRTLLTLASLTGWSCVVKWEEVHMSEKFDTIKREKRSNPINWVYTFKSSHYLSRSLSSPAYTQNNQRERDRETRSSEVVGVCGGEIMFVPRTKINQRLGVWPALPP